MPTVAEAALFFDFLFRRYRRSGYCGKQAFLHAGDEYDWILEGPLTCAASSARAASAAGIESCSLSLTRATAFEKLGQTRRRIFSAVEGAGPR